MCILDKEVHKEVSVLVNFAWVTRPERPKGAKDEVKRPEGSPTRSQGPEGPKTSSFFIYWQTAIHCLNINSNQS